MPRRLWVVALCLWGIFTAGVLASLLPPRLLDPRWQIGFINAVLRGAPLALIGLVLLHLAAFLDPDNPRLLTRLALLSRLALISSIGFLLLVPLQISATARGIQTASTAARRQSSGATETINRLQQEISTASSEADLQARLRRINVPLQGSPPANLPFPQRQRQLLENLERSRQQLPAAQKSTSLPAQQWWNVARSSLRVLPSSLFLAAAFWLLGRWGPQGQNSAGSREAFDYYRNLSRAE